MFKQNNNLKFGAHVGIMVKKMLQIFVFITRALLILIMEQRTLLWTEHVHSSWQTCLLPELRCFRLYFFVLHGICGIFVKCDNCMLRKRNVVHLTQYGWVSFMNYMFNFELVLGQCVSRNFGLLSNIWKPPHSVLWSVTPHRVMTHC